MTEQAPTTTTHTSHAHATAAPSVAASAAPEQLSLLPSSSVPVQFRLDAATRRRGLRHIAEIRTLLAERQLAAEHEHTHRRRRSRGARAA